MVSLFFLAYCKVISDQLRVLLIAFLNKFSAGGGSDFIVFSKMLPQFSSTVWLQESLNISFISYRKW
jgi:hypothetical protein